MALEQGTGIAKNISASGIYFETELPFSVGTALSFELSFDDLAGGPLRLTCEAMIVRVEQQDGKIGVGASIKDYKLQRPQTAALA